MARSACSVIKVHSRLDNRRMRNVYHKVFSGYAWIVIGEKVNSDRVTAILKGVGRVYQQTFIDAYAVARPPPSQAPCAQLAEATTPRPRACAG